MRRLVAIVLSFAGAALAPGAALADQGPTRLTPACARLADQGPARVPPRARLADQGPARLTPACARLADDGSARLAFIRARLDADARAVETWRWGWSLGYAAAATGQLGLALALDNGSERRIGLWVGATKAGIAFGAHLARPIATPREARQLAARAAAAPACAVVADAEAALARSAESEAEGRRWTRHAGVVGLNVVSLLVLGLGFARWEDGLWSAATGLVVGELQIATQPTGAVRAQRAYRLRVTLAPVAPTGGAGVHGLALAGTF